MISRRLRTALAAGVDPYFDSVVLLCHMDGVPGSTNFIDSSKYNRTLTTSGTAMISALQSKFNGTSYGNLSRANGYVRAATSADFDFGTDEFTIEAWVMRVNTQTSSYAGILCSGGNASGWKVYYQNNNGSGSGFTLGMDNVFITTGITLEDATWVHVAFTRVGNNFYTFKDGLLVSTNTSSLAINRGSTTSPIDFGNASNGGNPWNGHIDELRITKGVARYTSSFELPTRPYPDR
jgi:hypothetical protein